MNLNELPKTGIEARKLNCKFYFTGIPCKNGHIDKRHSKTSKCYGCKLDYARKYGKNNRDYFSQWRKNDRKNNPEKYKISDKLQREKNFKNHPDRLRGYSKKYKSKKKLDPLWRLNKNLSCAIWSWLKTDKGYKHWEEFVEFTKEELIAHLEKQFTPEMSWDNYGSFWHVDHIKPITLCENFEEAWELSNLQPLKKEDNLSKGNRYIGHPKDKVEVPF